MVRQLLTESSVLALGAGVVGVGGAALALRLLRAGRVSPMTALRAE